jgi:hypothetical protein
MRFRRAFWSRSSRIAIWLSRVTFRTSFVLSLRPIATTTTAARMTACATTNVPVMTSIAPRVIASCVESHAFISEAPAGPAP